MMGPTEKIHLLLLLSYTKFWEFCLVVRTRCLLTSHPSQPFRSRSINPVILKAPCVLMPTLSSRASLLGRVPRSSHEGFLYALSAASLPNLLLTPQESSPSHVPYLNMTYNLSVFFIVYLYIWVLY